MKFRILALAFLVVLVGLVGCAHPRHTAVVVDAALYESLNDVHQLEQRMLCGQPTCAGVAARVTSGWTDAKSQNFNQQLLPAISGGRELNTLLANWKAGDPLPVKIHDLITSLSASLSVVANDVPDGSTKSAILANIAKAQSLALTALDIVLSVSGGGK